MVWHALINLPFFTVHSFTDLVKYLFTIPGVTSFLSHHICQDPIEKFFGRQRQCGRVNENPSVLQFLNNNQTLRVVDSIKIETVKGNTRGLSSTSVIDSNSEPLPKRRRCSQKPNPPQIDPVILLPIESKHNTHHVYIHYCYTFAIHR